MVYFPYPCEGEIDVSELFRKSLQEEIAESSYDRPAGISFLAVILAIGGGLGIVLQLIAFSKLEDLSEVLGVSAVLVQGALLLLSGSALAAAVGMWIGAKWGWWLALFYFAYAVTRNANAFLSISSLADQFGASGEFRSTNYVKYGIRMVWNALLLAYLCRENASFYFRTTETSKWKALGIVFGISIGLFGLAALL